MKIKRWIAATMLILLPFAWILPDTAGAAARLAFEMKTSYSKGQIKVIVSGNHLVDLYAYHLYLNHDSAKVKLGFVNGYTDGTFNPQGITTRAQAATLIWRLLGMETKNEQHFGTV